MLLFAFLAPAIGISVKVHDSMCKAADVEFVMMRGNDSNNTKDFSRVARDKTTIITINDDMNDTGLLLKMPYRTCIYHFSLAQIPLNFNVIAPLLLLFTLYQ